MKQKIPDVNSIIKDILSCLKKDDIGMIASHIGIVRGYSLDAKKVKGLDIKFNKSKVDEIVQKVESKKGIVKVKVKLNEGQLDIGDWIMIVIIAGETRDVVFPALVDTVNLIKEKASVKKELL